MPHYEKVIKAGATELHYAYHDSSRPEPGMERRKRRKKEKPTPEKQRANNLRRAVQRLTADLNENFGPDCWYLTLNYDPKERPRDKKEINTHMAKVLRKLRNVYRSQNSILKYVWVPEVGPRGGSHIHIVVSAIDIRLIRDVWAYGGMYIEPLRPDRNYRRLASYFIEYSEKTRKTFKGKQAGRYNPSKNLVHPEAKKKKCRKKTFEEADIKVPDGWYLDKGSVQEWISEQGYKHMYYILVKLIEEREPE